jgi:hypothetical protein
VEWASVQIENYTFLQGPSMRDYPKSIYWCFYSAAKIAL